MDGPMSSAQSSRESPTVRRRRLGREIRILRERSELTLEEAGGRINWSDSKLSRLERGQGVVRWGDISDLLDLYEMADGPARDALVQLARDANLVGWWQPYSDILSKDYATYIDLETAATSLRQYQTLVVPGLLQTPDYARSVITDSGALNYRSDEVERRVTLRMERQAVLADENPLNLWAVSYTRLTLPTNREV